MRKFRALAAIVTAAMLLAACGNRPTSSTAAASATYTSLDSLVAAAKKEGSVVLYTDMLPTDEQSLTAAWKKAYPQITLKIQSISGTDLITRFESEVSAGTPSADVIASGQIDYYRTAAGKGLIVPLEKTGVLKLVPDYPKQYVYDDLDTALIQAVPSGFIYNTKKVPANKVPKTWEDLLDPFWKGHITAADADGMNNANYLLTYSKLVDQYGTSFLPKLAAQLGPSAAFQPMQAQVAAGQSYLGLQSLQFIVDGMKAKGAPVGFALVDPTYWPIHGFGVTTKASHPAAARLLAEFLLTKDGSHSVSGGVGEYGPYDQIPATFKPPTYDEITGLSSKADQLLGPFRSK